MRKLLVIILLTLSGLRLNGQQMSGTYTVGGSLPDFTTVVQAIDTIIARGVMGPVTFSIRPGSYSAFLNFPEISYNYLVTFTSESGNASDVILKMSNLYECRNLLFKKLTITPRTNTNYMFNYKGIEFAGCSDITFDSCTVRGTSDPNERFGITVSADQGNIFITNCSFRNLDHGFVLSNNQHYFGSNTHYGNHVVSACDFDSVSTGMRIQGKFGGSFSDTLLVYGCTVNASVTGIVVDGGNSTEVTKVTFEKNSVSCPGGSVLVIQNSPSSTTQSVLFRNNMLIGDVVLQNSDYTRFYFNSVAGKLHAWFGSTYIWSYNNIFSYSGTTPVVSVDDKNTFYSDYNDYFAPNASNLFFLNNNQPSTFTSLSAYSLSTGKDQHSLNVDPYFVSASDLHAYSPHLKYRALPVSTITNDFDGELRNVMPDIGADEFHASPLPPHAFYEIACGPGNYAISFLDTSVRAVQFYWDFGDGNQSTVEFPFHTWQGTGPYQVSLAVTNPYGSDTITDTVRFVQNIPQVQVNGMQLSVTNPQYSGYQWNFNGSPINQATQSTYTAPFPGLYSVSVYEPNCTCPYTSGPLPVGVPEITADNYLAVFPNPVTDMLMLHTGITVDAVEIRSVTGSLVKREEGNVRAMRMDECASGLYFVVVYTGQGVLRKPFVKN